MRTFQAHGAALLGANTEPAGFLKELARNLSHDEVIHAAVWSASRGGSPPVIVGRSIALDQMSIAAIADSYSLEGRASLLAPFRPGFYFQDPTGRRTLKFPIISVGAETKGLGREMRTRAFDSEVGFGIPAADELAEADRRHIGEVEVQARRVQMAVVNAFEPISGNWDAKEIETGIDRRFLADAVNLVRVRISAESLQASADVEFPSNALNANGEAVVEVRLEVSNAAVVFAGDRGDVESIGPVQVFARVQRDGDLPQVAATGTLFLPRIGPSTDTYFLVRTLARPGETLKGTLLLSVNRRLQQAIDLSISVSSHASSSRKESPSTPALKLEVRALPFVEFVDAAERREFDLGLFVNDGSDGSGRRIIAIDRDTPGLTLDKLRDAIATISEHVGNIAYRKEVDVAWGDALVVESLRVIADQGHFMRNAMERFWPSARGAPERIAIAGPWDQYVPIEYVYEGPAPDFSAGLCPEALARMKKGNCDDCPNRQASTVVCPLRFWGFSSEIERRYADTLEQARPGEGPSRRRLGRLKSSLLGYSDRTTSFDGGNVKVKKLIDKLSDVAQKTIPARDWVEWCSGVASHAPNLLILMPHTGKYQSRDALELGPGTTDNHWRAKVSISKADVGLTDQVEFVALLGCNTAGSSEQFATYPEQFRRYGADLMVTTIATLRGADAVPIATELVDMLKEAASSPQHLKTFGGFVTELRRKAFLAGAPGVLSVVAYGDADWVVGDGDV
jgi:hypothetical protein